MIHYQKDCSNGYYLKMSSLPERFWQLLLFEDVIIAKEKEVIDAK